MDLFTSFLSLFFRHILVAFPLSLTFLFQLVALGMIARWATWLSPAMNCIITQNKLNKVQTNKFKLTGREKNKERKNPEEGKMNRIE